jgi:hypothetical protein
MSETVEVEQEVEAPRDRQSKARAREGYTWVTCIGLPLEVIEELDGVKREAGFLYRHDAIAGIIGEIGLLSPAIRRGIPLVRTKDEGGCKMSLPLPNDLVQVVTASAQVGQVKLDRSRVLAAILLGVRSEFLKLARASFARTLAGAA